MISNGQTMDGLAKELSNRFDRPVIEPDRLEGQVRFEAALRPIEHARRTRRPTTKDIRDDPGQAPAGGDPANRIGADREPLSIFNALQEQLGLKLEGKKGQSTC